jgi:GT2 family glycosyltransferase
MQMAEKIHICAVLTVFNRKEKTIEALKAFFGQAVDCRLSCVLMDDGSGDGTADAVAQEFPQVTLLHSDGSLFWSGGMGEAFCTAMRMGADYYLWLNNDTVLIDGAIASLLEDARSQQAKAGKGGVFVGSTKDPETGAHTYGGVVRTSSWHPGKFTLIEPSQDEPIPCDSMNGNIVLISSSAAETLGGIDPYFTHSMGDYDYGLRALESDVFICVATGYHGFCSRNPVGTYWFEAESFRERMRVVNAPKGLPMKQWAYFLRKHGSFTWPFAWLLSYRRIITG